MPFSILGDSVMMSNYNAKHFTRSEQKYESYLLSLFVAVEISIDKSDDHSPRRREFKKTKKQKIKQKSIYAVLTVLSLAQVYIIFRDLFALLTALLGV